MTEEPTTAHVTFEDIETPPSEKPTDYPADIYDDYDKFWETKMNPDISWNYKVITITMKFVSFVLLFIALLSIVSMVWNSITLGADWNKSGELSTNATALLVFYCLILVFLFIHSSIWVTLACLCFLTTMRIPYKLQLSIVFTIALVVEVVIQFVQNIPNSLITYFMLKAHPTISSKVQPVGFFVTSVLGMVVLVFFAIIGVGLSVYHIKIIGARTEEVKQIRHRLLQGDKIEEKKELLQG